MFGHGPEVLLGSRALLRWSGPGEITIQRSPRADPLAALHNRSAHGATSGVEQDPGSGAAEGAEELGREDARRTSAWTCWAKAVVRATWESPSNT